MNIKEFGHRCWGATAVIFTVVMTGDYSWWVRGITILLMTYFFWFGAERFEPGYKKIV